MRKEDTQTNKQRYAATIIALLFCVLPGCAMPNAVKTDIQAVRNDMGRLEKVVEQKADNTVVAEHVAQINNKIEQTAQMAEDLSIWKKSVQAEVVNYGGAGWVVVVVLIFVVAGLLLIRAFMKRGNMLTMLTRAVQNSKYSTIVNIKRNLIGCVRQGYNHENDRRDLGNFAKKVGTFVKRDGGSEV